MIRKYIWIILVSHIFFIQGIIVLPRYGINWDSPFNYQKGQAILNFFISGRKDYSNLPECNYYQGSAYLKKSEMRKTCSSKEKLLRSVYQDSVYNLEEIFRLVEKRKGGHPPIAPLFASITNKIFYQWLGIMGDTDSYKLFALFSTFLTSLILGIWITQVYGRFAGIISVLSFSLYLLLLAEREFNFKDPVIMFFYLGTIYFFWLGFVKKKIILFFISSIFAGLALGTKFNIIFFPVILFPWLLLNTNVLLSDRFFSTKNLALILLFFLVIPIVILFLSYPYLWDAPVEKLIETVKYYKSIGSGVQYQDPRYYFLGFNTYPLQYLLFRTPVITLLLSVSGVLLYLFRVKREKIVVLLWISLFLFPIVRISLPTMSSYGGLRQVLEFVPGMALMVGYAAELLRRYIVKEIKYKNALLLYFTTLFGLYIMLFITLYKLHPLENLYFNFLIGGVKGASEKNFEGWKDVFGNGYFQGIRWVNNNVPLNSRLGIPIEGTQDRIPVTKLRSDIQYGGEYWSGPEKKGEYIVETNLTGTLFERYSTQFEVKTLNPISKILVDGVIVGYIYKNDLEHTKKEFRRSSTKVVPNMFSQKDTEILINFSEIFTAIELNLQYISNCRFKPNGWVSLENKKNQWVKLREPLGEQYYTLPTYKMGGRDGEVRYYMSYVDLKNIKIELFPQDENGRFCNYEIQQVSLFALQ